MTGVPGQHRNDLPDIHLEDLDCVHCRKSLGGILRMDRPARAAHPICEAQFVLENLLPSWPDDAFHRQELVKWSRGWPALDWAGAWARVQAGRHRYVAPPGRGNPPTVQNLGPAAGALGRAVVDPNARSFSTSGPLAGGDRESWVVVCKEPRCRFYR